MITNVTIEILLSVMSVVVIVGLILGIFALSTSTKQTEETIVHASISGNLVVKKNLLVKGESYLKSKATLHSGLKVTNYVSTESLEVLEKLTIGDQTLLPGSFNQLLTKKEFLSLSAKFSAPLKITRSIDKNFMIDLTPWDTGSEFSHSGDLFSKDIKGSAASLALLPPGVYGFSLTLNAVPLGETEPCQVVPLLIVYTDDIEPFILPDTKQWNQGDFNRVVCDLTNLNNTLPGAVNTIVDTSYTTDNENFMVSGVASFPILSKNSKLGLQIVIFSSETLPPIDWKVNTLQLNIFRII